MTHTLAPDGNLSVDLVGERYRKSDEERKLEHCSRE
jgi:hypothetical protein